MQATMVESSTHADSQRTLEELLDEIEVGQYRISTMTCIYDFHLEIDEQKVYEMGEKILVASKKTYDEKETDIQVIGVECFDKPMIGKQIQKKRGKLSKRKFRNQITLILWTRKSQKYIKVKMFRTGRAQMTGVTSEREGLECVQFLCGMLNENKEYLELSHPVSWSESDWTIAMMNGDLDVGSAVSRETLNSIVCKQYGITSNLDADTYPGVIMKYSVYGKQITISVFSSGKVIITGANARIQIERCVQLVRFLCSQL